MLKIEFKDVKIGEVFVFGGKVMSRVAPVVVNSISYNVKARNGEGWLFNDNDLVTVVRKEQVA